MPLKTNRKALVLGKNEQKRIDELQLLEGQTVEIQLEQVNFPLLLTKAVYHNKTVAKGYSIW